MADIFTRVNVPSPGSSALPIHRASSVLPVPDSPSSRMAGILLFSEGQFSLPSMQENTSFRPSAETLSGTGFLLSSTAFASSFKARIASLTSRAILLVDGSAKRLVYPCSSWPSDSDAFQFTAFEMSSSFFRPLLLSHFRTESLMTSSSISHSSGSGVPFDPRRRFALTMARTFREGFFKTAARSRSQAAFSPGSITTVSTTFETLLRPASGFPRALGTPIRRSGWSVSPKLNGISANSGRLSPHTLSPEAILEMTSSRSFRTTDFPGMRKNEKVIFSVFSLIDRSPPKGIF